MKFDLDKAWRDATGMLKAHFGLLATIAGVFYFVPNAAVTNFIPEFAMLSNPAAGADSDAMLAMIEALVAKYWWLLAALVVLGGIGNLAMLALVRLRSKPTVAEAIGQGFRAIPTYIASQLLQGLGLFLVAVLLIGVPGILRAPALVAIGSVLALVLIAYVFIKLSLVSPVIAIEGERNPVAALRRSWQLTRRNSLRLFLFYLLLIVAFIVVSSVVSLVATLVLAFAGAETARFGMTVVESAMNAIAGLVGVCVIAAVHTQLVRLRGSSAITEEA